jgi:23S rRNA (adenine2503-C2)-methyltransferase
MEDVVKQPLLGLTLNELKTVVTEEGMPAFAAKQLAQWLYVRGARSFGEMTDLSVHNREKLAQRYEVGISDPVEQQRSTDGTVKYLFRTQAGDFVETVYIPEDERATLCVSSQVGCRMRCAFCMTGKQGFSGNLTACDILNQIYALPQRGTLTNVVFMGQGEPLDNLDNVLRACSLLTAGYGLAWSPKRITVSTVGLRKSLERFLDESECHVAISLHNAFAEQRAAIMPAEKAFPIEEVVATLRRYDFSHQRRLSFEYIVFGGVNDSVAHVKALVRLLSGLECRVNLIRFHQVPNVELHGADEAVMERMRDYLTSHGVFTTIRASRGEDILAACGLLSTAKQQGINIDKI